MSMDLVSVTEPIDSELKKLNQTTSLHGSYPVLIDNKSPRSKSSRIDISDSKNESIERRRNFN
jgi:hypothetical protein